MSTFEEAVNDWKAHDDWQYADREAAWKWFFERGREATIKESLPVPDLDRCPSCGGPADNGNDRLVPPNPYLCSKCDPI